MSKAAFDIDLHHFSSWHAIFDGGMGAGGGKRERECVCERERETGWVCGCM